MPHNFALTGVAGFIAPRHLKAIRDTGNRVIAAVDPHDSVGILDSFGFDVKFFTEFERFDRQLEKLRRGPAEQRVHYLSVCSPNYLHDAHVRLALRVGANAICEKPLVINPWNLDALQALEAESDGRVYTVLQLRVHPSLVALRERLREEPTGKRHQVRLTYITSRGSWYHTSWKGYPEKSGGLATNIGIHFFDLLMWLFGNPTGVELHHDSARRMAGAIALEHADVQWLLSVDFNDLPFAPEPGKKTTFRSITVDGEEVEFSEGFGDLHTRVYERTLAGDGFTLDEARPSIELVHRIRQTPVRIAAMDPHPLVAEIARRDA